jgi:hypothetical protein
MDGAERTERFDRDPGWDGRNNRTAAASPREVKQDFGYSLTARAGGNLGEMGGFISPAAEPAYYAKRLPPKTLDDRLVASGMLSCDGRPLHVLIGFFNAVTLNEWRTPNSIALRISGRGDVFYAWLEYATEKWRAGGDSPQPFPTARDPKTGRQQFKGFAANAVHRWTLEYDPQGNAGRGVVTATIGDAKAICSLDEGHRADGANFNHFGLLTVMKSADTGGQIWLDDVAINGEKEDFSKDPGWVEHQNRRTYQSTLVRPLFDFGWSPTNHAGGQKAGELGGTVFRGDCRYPNRMAHYGDRLEVLTLEKPLRAGGKVCLKRGVTDSSVLIGFFHSELSTARSDRQDQGLPRCFLGISTDGPSREGFLFSPTYRIDGDGVGNASTNQPHIYPDGKPHDWTLSYDPAGAWGRGEITVTLDKHVVRLPLAEGHKKQGARFNRFGIITTWIDGNSQTLYFDDLTFTSRQE